MAATTQLDKLRRRMGFTRGYQDKRLDSGVRPFRTVGLDNSNTDLSAAIASAVTAAGGAAHAHPSDSSLRIHSANAIKFSATQAFGMLRYARGPASPPTQAAFSFAREIVTGGRQEFIPTIEEDYDSIEINGVTIYYDRITYARVRTPIVRIIVPTVLSAMPIASVASMYGKLNSDSFSINGYARAAETLLFDGAEIYPIDTTGGLVYVVGYKFEWKPTGWTTKNVTATSVPYTVPGYSTYWYGIEYSIISNHEYATTAFTGNFPVHA
jgi:hypothetical protein